VVRVDQARKRARNFGEDLLEDMLTLDGLSGLVNEDRAKRKAAIADIETLLGDVDAAKQRLGGLQKQLQADLDSLSIEPEEVPEANTQMQSNPSRHPVGTGGQSACQPHVPCSKPRNQLGAPGRPNFSLPLPSCELWEQVKLPVHFRAREKVDGYEIRAAVPGVAMDDIGIGLGEDGSTLTVSGLRAPTARRAEQMHRQLTAWVWQQIQRSPEQAQRIMSRLAEITEKGFLDLGQGEFGRFTETFRFPQDADTASIQASYHEGVLSVIIPKRARRFAPRAAYGGLGNPYGGW